MRPTSMATGRVRLGAANLAGAARNETPITTPAQSSSKAPRAFGATPGRPLVSRLGLVIGVHPQESPRAVPSTTAVHPPSAAVRVGDPHDVRSTHRAGSSNPLRSSSCRARTQAIETVEDRLQQVRVFHRDHEALGLRDAGLPDDTSWQVRRSVRVFCVSSDAAEVEKHRVGHVC